MQVDYPEWLAGFESWLKNRYASLVFAYNDSGMGIHKRLVDEVKEIMEKLHAAMPNSYVERSASRGTKGKIMSSEKTLMAPVHEVVLERAKRTVEQWDKHDQYRQTEADKSLNDPQIGEPDDVAIARTVLRMNDAIEKTIGENGHLADGDDCTLIHLKRALSA